MNSSKLQSARILISGGGIAGLALAYWLKKIGVDPVVIDHAREFKPMGHFIALKGNGVEVVRQMGLESACRKREIQFSQAVFMTSAGKLLRMGSRSEYDSNLGGYILLQRSDLHAALFDAVARQIQIHYGTEIVAIRRAKESVEVDLSTGRTESFDVVIGADGVHSKTRNLAFGEGYEIPLGGQYFGLTEKFAHGLDISKLHCFFGQGQSVSLIPTSPGSVSAVVYHGDGGLEPKARDNESIKTFLLEAYRDFPVEVRNLFSTIDNQSFVFMDKILQVRMPSIVKGRIALVGDAAHCPTFMSGMGSSLALQGARTLAMRLQKNAKNLPLALAQYETEITPIAGRYRDSALKMRPLLLDRRGWVRAARNFTLRFMPQWALDKQVRKFYQAESLVKQGGKTLSVSSSS